MIDDNLTWSEIMDELKQTRAERDALLLQCKELIECVQQLKEMVTIQANALSRLVVDRHDYNGGLDA